MYYYLSIQDQLGHILKKFSIDDLKNKNNDNYVLKDISIHGLIGTHRPRVHLIRTV